jgi:fimbrial chaperone protein
MRIILILLISQLTFAFNFTPLSQSIIIGKNNETVIYQVENKNKEPIAVEVSLIERIMDRNGKEKHPEVADGLFLLYPTQLILKPGQKRGIKVKWLGKDVKSEKAFRIKVEQLPIDFKKEKSSGIKLLLKYLGALYVSKDQFKSKIKAKILSIKDNMVAIEVSNSGQKHQVLRKLKVEFKNKTKKKTIVEGEILKGMDGENVLSKSNRIFKIPLSEQLTKFNLSKETGVSLKYE